MGRELTEVEFEDLYCRTVRDVFDYMRRRTPLSAEDLVAETYVIAWRRRAAMPSPVLRRAWLFAVARNLLKAEARRHQRERELVEQLAAVPEPAPRSDTGDRLEHVVADALTQLGVADREVLQLATWESLSPTEIALVLGIRPGTARVRLYRARRAIASNPAVQALVDPESSVVSKA